MAEVTYYFNARHVSEVWTDPDDAVDNNLGTSASTTVNNEVQRLTGNTCPGDDLGTITKVEIRAYAYGDGDDELYIRPEFAGGPGDNHITVPVVSPGDWVAYQDITDDSNAPDWSAWSHIQDLECDIELDDTSKGNTMYVAKVEVRVTYAEIDVGLYPVDRASYFGDGATLVAKDNPANASGTLTTIKIWASSNLTALRVGTFYTTNGNTLKCRDSASIGAVAAGAVRTFTEDSEAAPLAITVVAGDYIGCYYTAGTIERDSTGYGGLWIRGAEEIDPGDEATYDFEAGDTISLLGYGDIVVVAAPPRHGFVNFQVPGVV